MGSAWRLWPVLVTKEHDKILDKQIDCIIKIMQNKDGIDSRNFIVSTIYSNYYLTTDYRYLRQFRAQFKKIREKCVLKQGDGSLFDDPLLQLASSKIDFYWDDFYAWVNKKDK